MSLLSNLFGKKSPEADLSDSEKVLQMLREAEELAAQNPRKALKYLQKKSKSVNRHVEIGGKQHEEFGRLIVKILSIDSPEKADLQLPTAKLFSCGQVPMLSDLIKAAENTPEEIICDKWERDNNIAVEQVLVLIEFIGDPQLVMAVVGDGTILLRKSFLLSAKQSVQDTEEIGPALEDFASSQGLKVRFLN